MSVSALNPNDGYFRERSAFLGVSLSNRTFSRQFCRALFAWVPLHFDDLFILVGNVCEEINYQVFKGLAPAAAALLAQQRAVELRRMFSRYAITSSVRTHIALESECDWLFTADSSYPRTLLRLERATELKGQLSGDIREQVTLNLAGRTSIHGSTFIQERIDDLSRYVVRELALFHTLRTAFAGSNVIEVYPGHELMVKRRLFNGAYERETGIPALSYKPPFADVSFLCPRTPLPVDLRPRTTAA